MEIKEIIEFRKKVKEISVKELYRKDFLNELSKLHLSIIDLLSFINPKRKPICIKEK